MKKIKKIISLLLVTLIIFGPLTTPVRVLALPESPSSPESPDSPDSPDDPDTPENPTLPGEDDAASQDTPTPDPSPSPSSDPSPSPSTSPSPSPSPSSEPLTTQDSSESDSSSADGYVGGDPSIETGDATVTGTISNDANTNVSTDGGDGYSGGATITNEDNGAGSTNSGSIIEDSSSATLQDNDAEVDNSIILTSTTGENSTSENVAAENNITSGDANATGTIINSINTNIDGVMVAEFNIDDDHLGDYILDYDANCISGCGGGEIDLTNEGNGADSQNTATVDTSSDSLTFQENDADVTNELILTANSGDNTADNNTGGDSNITTGDAYASGNVINFLNNNLAGNVIYGVVNIFGDLVGDIIIPDEYLAYYQDYSLQNLDNGSGSTNTTSVDQTTTDEYTQFNNAEIINNVELAATTGDNSVTGNTGGNTNVLTGNVNVDAQIINIANTNIIGGTWWIVLINEAGQWFGKILGAPDGANYAGSSGTGFSVSDNGIISITNDGNGSDSTNTGSVSNDSTNSTTQNNNAKVTNNISLAANTGGNSASRNTGGNSNIVTGDATVMLNLVNFINNNFAGGNVLFTVINVFGSWIGDLVAPGQTQEVNNALASGDQTLAIGGPSGSTSSNNTTNSNTTSSLGLVQAAIASITTPTPNTNNNPQLASNLLGTDTESAATVDTLTKAKKKIRINLAWALPLAFMYLAFRGTRKLAAFLPRKK